MTKKSRTVAESKVIEKRTATRSKLMMKKMMAKYQVTTANAIIKAIKTKAKHAVETIITACLARNKSTEAVPMIVAECMQ